IVLTRLRGVAEYQADAVVVGRPQKVRVVESRHIGLDHETGREVVQSKLRGDSDVLRELRARGRVREVIQVFMIVRVAGPEVVLLLLDGRKCERVGARKAGRTAARRTADD